MARAAACLGFATGIFNLLGFAAQRSLGGPEWVVPLITFWQALWIVAPAVEPVLSRFPPRKAFRWIGLVACAPILLVALLDVVPTGSEGRGVGSVPLLMGAMFLWYATNIVYVPHRVALLSANMPAGVRGRVYAMLSATELIVTMVTARIGGSLLDGDPRWLRAIFPVGAAVGFLGYGQLSRIRWRWERQWAHRRGARRDATMAAVGLAWRKTLVVFRRDRGFRLYEIGFMLYGMGLLMSQPLVTILAERDLRLSYGEWTRASAVAFPLTMIAVMTFLGRIVDRLGVARTTGGAFLVLSVFFATLPAVTGAWGLAGAHVILGLGMAGVSLGWNLGPLHFAPEGRARAYGAVHLLLVGVRSALAPGIGYALMRLVSIQAAFLLSAALQLAAFLVIRRARAMHEDA